MDMFVHLAWVGIAFWLLLSTGTLELSRGSCVYYENCSPRKAGAVLRTGAAAVGSLYPLPNTKIKL